MYERRIVTIWALPSMAETADSGSVVGGFCFLGTGAHESGRYFRKRSNDKERKLWQRKTDRLQRQS